MTISQTSILEIVGFFESDNVVVCIRAIQCKASTAPGLFLDARTLSTSVQLMGVCWMLIERDVANGTHHRVMSFLSLTS